MKLHDLEPNTGAKKRRKRIGRGISAGQGKTAGRGMKGQKARAGGGTRLYFTGGNLPFYRRLPYVRGRGFRVFKRVRYNEVNLDQLSAFADGSEVSPATLQEANLLRDKDAPVAILGRGSVERALKISTHRISAGARSKVEAKGGTVELIGE